MYITIAPVKGYRFKGWGWRELGSGLGMPVDLDEDAALLWIEEALIVGDAAVAPRVRRFLKALSRQAHQLDYLGPLWDGLRAIEDDGELLRLTRRLLPDLWT
jgi:hypothetical protein